MITWNRFKDIVKKQAGAARVLGFGHPLNPDVALPFSPEQVDKATLDAFLETAWGNIERGFASDWPESGYFLVGRSALCPELETIQRSFPWRGLMADGQPLWAGVQQEIIGASFAPDTELSLLSLFVGPVQDFISEARKVRDLWAGSFLLAAATFQALIPVLEKYGPDVVIHPHLHETVPFQTWVKEQYPGSILPSAPSDLKRLASLPNRALVVIPTAEVADIGRLAKEKLKEYWLGLSDNVWQRFPAPRQPAINSTLWQQQLKDHFHLYYTAVPVVRQTWLQTYGSIQAAAQNFFEARKLTRSFTFWPTPDFRDKCTLCNHREVVGPAQRSPNKGFWQDLVNKSQGRLRPGERFCATCLAKRLIRDADLGVPRFAFDSTSDIAMQSYRTAVAQLIPQDFVTAISLLKTAIGREGELRTLAEVPGDWFYLENLETSRFLKREAPALPAESLPEAAYALELAREELQKIYRQFGKAPSYYAVLMMDGDEMGKWMSGAHPDPVRLPLTLARHSSLSQILTTLGRDVMPPLLADWQGVLVYAGGDDLLALGPLHGVLEAAQRLQTGFREGLPAAGLLGLGPEASISAGLVLAHHTDSLEKVLETAREAERQAKEVLGRAALNLVVRFSAGSLVTGGFKWQIPLASRGAAIPLTVFLQTLAAWLGHPEKGLSPRFLYRVMESLEVFYPTQTGRPPARAPLAAELSRLLRRHLPADSPVWQQRDPFSPAEFLELLLYLADPDEPGQTWPPKFACQENIKGLLKIALFLAREHIS